MSGIPAKERYLLESLAVIPVDISAVPTLSWAMANFSREELAMNWQRELGHSGYLSTLGVIYSHFSK